MDNFDLIIEIVRYGIYAFLFINIVILVIFGALVELNADDPHKGEHILLIIAHPDDEAM